MSNALVEVNFFVGTYDAPAVGEWVNGTEIMGVLDNWEESRGEWLISDVDGWEFPGSGEPDYSMVAGLVHELEMLSHYNLDAFRAYCTERAVSAEEFENEYYGTYSSAEEFAQEFADGIGDYSGQECWPYNCIDWELAARELMYDFTEIGGHYFRD